MRRPDLFLAWAGIVGVALFVVAVVHLLSLRYERGDVYPPSSTLRPDPLGTRAFYEALSDTGLYRVSRGYEASLRRELAQKPATFFVLGWDKSQLTTLDPDEVRELGRYVWNGGRVVITLASTEPVMDESDDEKPRTDKKPGSAKAPPSEAIPEPPGPPGSEQEKYERTEWKRGEEERRDAEPDRYVPEKFHPSVMARWGFGWQSGRDKPKPSTKDKQSDTDKAAAASTVEYSSHDDVLAVHEGRSPTEAQVPWQSPGFFKRLDPAWRIDYRAKDQPVLIDRMWGQGEIIVAGDSYFVSNEALRSDRAPRLLSWLAGPPGLALFDETHLGTQARDSIMTLIRRYHLEGVIYGLLLATGLLVWRQSVPLVPARSAQATAGGVISGKDSRSGLVNILRRNLVPGQLLSICMNEWRRSSAARRSDRAARMEAVVATSNPTEPSQLVASYRRLCEIRNEGLSSSRHANKP